MIRHSFVAVLLLWGCKEPSDGRASEVEPLLAQDELTAKPALLAARAKITPGHEARASAFEQEGRAALAQARFAPAAKSFGSAALYAPTPLRLYAYAAASARIPRPRATAAETSDAKRRDVDAAQQVLQAAASLAGDSADLAVILEAERSCLSRIEQLRQGDSCYLPRMP